MTRGIIAGAVAAVAQNVYIFGARMAGFTKVEYEDYAEILFFSKFLPGFFPSFLGLIGHLVWNVFLGIIFAYIIKYSSSKFYVLKGIVFGAFVWWLVKVFCTLFRLPALSNPPYQQVGVFLIGSLLFGVVVAYTLKLLDTKWETTD